MNYSYQNNRNIPLLRSEEISLKQQEVHELSKGLQKQSDFLNSIILQQTIQYCDEKAKELTQYFDYHFFQLQKAFGITIPPQKK